MNCPGRLPTDLVVYQCVRVLNQDGEEIAPCLVQRRENLVEDLGEHDSGQVVISDAYNVQRHNR